MLTAGLAFAIVNSVAQYASIQFGLPSTTVALVQYAIAIVVILPYLKTLGIRQSLRTQQFGWHLLRVFLAVIGIQLWLWALAYPVPIWQGIALLMTSPLLPPLALAYGYAKSGHGALGSYPHRIYRCDDHPRALGG